MNIDDLILGAEILSGVVLVGGAVFFIKPRADYSAAKYYYLKHNLSQEGAPKFREFFSYNIKNFPRIVYAVITDNEKQWKILNDTDPINKYIP